MSEFQLTYRRGELIDEVKCGEERGEEIGRILLTATLYGTILLHSLPHDNHTFLELVMRHRHVLYSVPYQSCWAQIYRKGYHFLVLSSKMEAERRAWDRHYDYCCRVLSTWEAVGPPG